MQFTMKLFGVSSQVFYAELTAASTYCRFCCIVAKYNDSLTSKPNEVGIMNQHASVYSRTL